jgi:hypothetical protein
MKKLSISFLLCFSFLYLNNEAGSFESLELSFSEERMVTYAKSIGIKYIDVMVAQSRIETGWYSSRVFLEGANLFGMKVAKQRPTTASGEHRRHARYSDWFRSVQDYKLWQEMVLTKVESKKEYMNYIAKHYAQNPNYLNLIKKQI